MERENPFWKPLQSLLKVGFQKSLFILTLVVLVLPIAEGVLTETWSSAPNEAKSAAGWTLAVVAFIHAILGFYILWSEFAGSPHMVVGKAFELQEQSNRQRRELDRREATYRLVRGAFDGLNLQTCTISGVLDEERWCHGGFHYGLAPILQPFIEQAEVAFGLSTRRFTLEAYFDQDRVPVRGRTEVCSSGLCQHFFFGEHVGRCAGVCLEACCSPAKLARDAGTAFEQHISSNQQLFFDGANPKSAVYFRRYAVVPITESCSDVPMGVLVLTSMQDEEFAPDILDTLKFISTLITHFHAAYWRCFYEAEYALEEDAADFRSGDNH